MVVAAPADLSGLSLDAQRVYAFLKDEGALFQADVRAGLVLIEETGAHFTLGQGVDD